MEQQNMETEKNRTLPPPTFLTQNINTTTVSTQPVQKSLHVFRRSRKRCTDDTNGGKELMKEKEEDENSDEDDKEEIERKINALQRIVPNGESFGVDKLFDETAEYILALQYQVKALKALTSFFQNLDKEKSKLGG